MATTDTTTNSTSGPPTSNVSVVTIRAELAQPTIGAIQQNIKAFLPGDLASAITSQFVGPPASQSSTGSAGSASSSGTPALTLNFPSVSPSGTAASIGSSLAAPITSTIINDISSFLPSGLASAIASQFAGASSTSGQAEGLTLQFAPFMPPMLVSSTSSGG